MSNMVWVFSANSSFPAGIFSTFNQAKSWIAQHQLTGVLTEYPLDTGAYDWCVEKHYFQPKSAHHASPSFIAQFTCGAMTHYHFEDGIER